MTFIVAIYFFINQLKNARIYLFYMLKFTINLKIIGGFLCLDIVNGIIYNIEKELKIKKEFATLKSKIKI